MFTRRRLLTLACLIAIAVCFLTPAAAKSSKSDLDKRIKNAEKLLDRMMLDPKHSIPKDIITNSKGIMFVEQFRAGFIVAIRGGQGLGFLHNGKGGWSAPAFYRVGGASLGLQAGGDRQRLVLVIMTEDGTRIMTGNSGEIGADISYAAGPVGDGADISNMYNVPILVYGEAAGLYAGLSIKGGVLSPSPKSNRTYYDNYDVTVLDILEGRVKMPNEAKSIIAQLSKYVKEGKKNNSEK